MEALFARREGSLFWIETINLSARGVHGTSYRPFKMAFFVFLALVKYDNLTTRREAVNLR